MNVSARTDYAIRAMLQLAVAPPGAPVPLEEIADGQDLPRKFLEAIFSDLRRAGLVTSVRGSRGGYLLADAGTGITVGQVVRAVDGPLWEVRGLRPQDTEYAGAAQHLPTVWVALRAAIRRVADETTLEHLASGRLPNHVQTLADEPEAWLNR